MVSSRVSGMINQAKITLPVPVLRDRQGNTPRPRRADFPDKMPAPGEQSSSTKTYRQNMPCLCSPGASIPSHPSDRHPWHDRIVLNRRVVRNRGGFFVVVHPVQCR